jgi:hypothetical protein
MNIYHSQIENAVEVFEFSPTEEKQTEARVIYVPPDAVAFAIGVGRMDGETFSRAENVTVSVTKGGQPLTPVGAIADIEDGNVRAYMSNSPPTGEWMVRVSHNTAEAFVVSVALFRKPLSALLRFKNKHQCKACQLSIRAVIYALLAKLTAGAIHILDIKHFAEHLVHLAGEMPEFLAKTIGVSAHWLKELFGGIGEILGIETPWGWLARRICEKLGLCRAGAADD